jgi:hypothetical protein
MIPLQTRPASWHAHASSAADAVRFVVRETPPTAPPKPRLLDRVRAALRARHYSRRTEEAYVAWILTSLAPSPAMRANTRGLAPQRNLAHEPPARGRQACGSKGAEVSIGKFRALSRYTARSRTVSRHTQTCVSRGRI